MARRCDRKSARLEVKAAMMTQSTRERTAVERRMREEASDSAPKTMKAVPKART